LVSFTSVQYFRSYFKLKTQVSVQNVMLCLNVRLGVSDRECIVNTDKDNVFGLEFSLMSDQRHERYYIHPCSSIWPLPNLVSIIMKSSIYKIETKWAVKLTNKGEYSIFHAFDRSLVKTLTQKHYLYLYSRYILKSLTPQRTFKHSITFWTETW
jgi:hypothetical protein